jgi:hypothetical protein
MLRTLGVLVLSMTGTASLLAWADPGANLPGVVIPPSDLITLAQAAAVTEISVPQDRWDTIELVAVPGTAGGAHRMLTATKAQPSHFELDDLGRCSRSDLWTLQRDSGTDSRTIRVAVSRGEDQQPMTLAQWTGVRALVGALQSVRAEQDLEVVVDDFWAQAYGVVPGQQVAIDAIPPVRP